MLLRALLYVHCLHIIKGRKEELSWHAVLIFGAAKAMFWMLLSKLYTVFKLCIYASMPVVDHRN